MPTPDATPWVVRRRLATRLRRLRMSANRTIDEAAAELICSVAKISRMETTGRGCSERDVRDLCRFYGATDAVRAELMHAAAMTRLRGWWHEFGPLDEQFERYVDFESTATVIREYDSSLLPGLLQTVDFARALVPSLSPRSDPNPEWVDRVVRLRMERQKRILNRDVELHALIDEAAVRRNIGSRVLMVRQLEHLIQSTQRDNVRIQVVPFEAGHHAGLQGSFHHLTMPVVDEDPFEAVVYVEGQFGSFVLDKEAEVATFLAIFRDISSRVALDEEASIRWLKQLHDAV